MVVYFLAAVAGCINVAYYIRTTLCIAVAASIGIFLQYICWYLFGFHLQLVATDFLLAESKAWVALAQTGTIGVTGREMGFYRPSSFFLEPSHMFLYLMPHLFLLLLTPNINRIRITCAAVLSLGLIFSTSGMGMAVVYGVWMLWLGFGGDNRLCFRNIFHIKNILRCVLFTVMFFGICLSVPALQRSILRIFLDGETINKVVEELPAIGGELSSIDEVGGSNAVSGRTKFGFAQIKKMRGIELLVGISDSMSQFNFNKAGFVATMYKYGAIGIALSYSLYLYGAAFLKAPCRWLAIILLVVSFFSAHTHGTFYMMYYSFVLLDGYFQKQHGAKPD
jgi:hypothetical protein